MISIPSCNKEVTSNNRAIKTLKLFNDPLGLVLEIGYQRTFAF